MSITVLPLFVYGSLRSGFQHPAYAYISRYFELAGTAKVKGDLFDMGDFPAAVPSDAEHWIVGELYRIKQDAEFPWAIGQLDDYEGINGEADEPVLYGREQTTVYLNDAAVEAWIYWYKGDVSNNPRIECGDLLLYTQQKNKQ